ncbi:MULE domain-containing protein, partial [Aphis craccivora]
MAVETTELLHDDMSSIRKSMYRERQKIIPAAPTSLFKLIQQLKINNISTHRNETFCHVDEESKILIFTTNNNLEYLVNNSHIILRDGTFYVCPAHFEQLYTIHVLHKSIYVQVVYCLLPSKTTDIYVKMWHLIKTLCKKELKPQNILLDFEQIAHNGILRIFPN